MTGDPGEIPRLTRTREPRRVLLDLLESVPDLADLPVIFISAYRRDETGA